MDLTDAQWRLIEPLIPVPPRRADGRGRPRCNPREVMNGILWVMRTGAAWADIPSRYPSSSTCHRYFQAWVSVRPDSERSGRGFVCTWPDRLGRVLYRRHICASQKGGTAVGKTKHGKGSKIMAIADCSGLPIAIHVSSASPHESQLVEPTLDARFVADEPKRLIGDKAYDSDSLDAALAKRGIEMIAPHRSNRTAPKTQDGRSLRRYKRRWKVERLNSWLLSYRRIAVRYEYKVENYIGFVHLACIRILLRHHF
jgi:transposase